MYYSMYVHTILEKKKNPLRTLHFKLKGFLSGERFMICPNSKLYSKCISVSKASNITKYFSLDFCVPSSFFFLQLEDKLGTT